jgi:hypothetical protein
MTYNDILSKFSIRRLQEGERVESFDCGDDDLNDFILNESHLYRKELLAVSYVLEDRATKNVAGYFSLANDRISISDFPNNNLFNRFRKRFVNRKRITSYPAAKVCRLGIDKSVMGESIGSFLIDFIKSYFRFDNKTGCRFLTVDAYNDAVPFYEKNQFLPLATENNQTKRTKLLYYDLASME